MSFRHVRRRSPSGRTYVRVERVKRSNATQATGSNGGIVRDNDSRTHLQHLGPATPSSSVPIDPESPTMHGIGHDFSNLWYDDSTLLPPSPTSSSSLHGSNSQYTTGGESALTRSTRLRSNLCENCNAINIRGALSFGASAQTGDHVAGFIPSIFALLGNDDHTLSSLAEDRSETDRALARRLRRLSLGPCDFCNLVRAAFSTGHLGKEFAFYRSFEIAPLIFEARQTRISDQILFTTLDYCQGDRKLLMYAPNKIVLCADTHHLVDHGITGRIPSPYPDETLYIQWIAECSNSPEHRNCPTISDVDLPTRLIDVSEEGRPKLVHTEGRSGTYVTLSHCWGNVAPLKTTLANLAAHERLIPLGSLSLKFRDAIEVTRNLGFCYLWIDSLCIIQDEGGDWARQCSRMGKIFENAAVTIAAATDGDEDRGLRHRRPRPVPEPCEFVFHEDDGTESKVAAALIDPQRLVTWESASDCTLLKRGWVLQERLFSPRILYFEADEVHFECNHAVRHETYIPEITRDNSADFADVPKNVLCRGGGTFELWKNIVKTFSRCLLSYECDKLPALSGIVQRLVDNDSGRGGHPELGHYLAGIWSLNIAEGLTWYSLPVRLSHIKKADFRPPTWSWASCQSPVSFFPRSSENTIEIASHLIQFDVLPAGDNIFGEVFEGALQLVGPLKTGRLCSLEASLHGSRRYSGSLYLCDIASTLCNRLCPVEIDARDRPLRQEVSHWDGREVACLLLYRSQDESRQGFEWIALLLQPAEEHGTFRRIGICRASEREARVANQYVVNSDDRFDANLLQWWDNGIVTELTIK